MDSLPNLQQLNLYLIGMMGAGKSTVGKVLAKRLGYQFFDTDTVIAQVTKQSVSQLFAEAGEAEFRRLETQVLNELSAYKQLVIATGGGIVTQPQNWGYLRYGLIVWLDVPVPVLMHRLRGCKSRPLLQTADPAQTLTTLLEQRQPFYAQADLRIPVTIGDAAEQVATRVLEQIPSVLKAPVVYDPSLQFTLESNFPDDSESPIF